MRLRGRVASVKFIISTNLPSLRSLDATLLFWGTLSGKKRVKNERHSFLINSNMTY